MDMLGCLSLSLFFFSMTCDMSGFPGGSVVKNLPANTGDAEDVGLIPGSRRSLEEEMATHSSIPTWTIPWTEKPGELQSMGWQRFGCDRACMHDIRHHVICFFGIYISSLVMCPDLVLIFNLVV